MEKYNWKSKFFIIWTGQAVSLITSAILQMAIILIIGIAMIFPMVKDVRRLD